MGSNDCKACDGYGGAWVYCAPAEPADWVPCEMCRATGKRLPMCRLCEEVPAEEDSALCAECHRYLEAEDEHAHELAHGPEVAS